MTRLAFVKVCYATFSLERSMDKSHDLNHRATVNVEHRDARPGHHRDILAEKPRDVEDKHQRVVEMEHHRDVHRDIQVEKPRDVEDEHHRDVHRDIQAEKPRDVADEHHRDMEAEHHRDDIQVEKPRDVEDKHHRDVPTEHHRAFISSVHREVHAQLTSFLANNVDNLSMMWQPYVVEYYSQLTTLCLNRSLTSDEEFIPLLSLCLKSSLYDVRLSALRFIAGVLAGASTLKDDDDDDDDDDDVGVFPPYFPGRSTANIREILLSKLMTSMAGDCGDLYQLLIDMLLYSETHDECLLMVSC